MTLLWHLRADTPDTTAPCTAGTAHEAYKQAQPSAMPLTKAKACTLDSTMPLSTRWGCSQRNAGPTLLRMQVEGLHAHVYQSAHSTSYDCISQHSTCQAHKVRLYRPKRHTANS